MSYGLVQTVVPGAEPVSLVEAKLHLRVEHDVDNDLITSLLKAARQFAETWTGRAFVTQTWQLKMDRFPSTEGRKLWPRDERDPSGGVIRIPKPPLSSLTSVQYVDTAGATQTLASSKYYVDTSTEPGRMVPASGESWPFVRDQTAAVTITFVAGYGAAADVPDGIKVAIKLLAASWYENREALKVGVAVATMPLAVESLLQSFWTGEYT
jgi:uncharacterized phiE125 gp8 family phage protein